MDDRIGELSQRWVEGMSRRGRSSRRAPRPMSPWDEIPYFDLAKGVNVSVNGGANSTPVVPFEPRRVGLIMCCFGTGPIFVSPTDMGANQAGLILQNTTLPYGLTQKDWGILVQSAWFAQTTAVGAQLHVIELLLKGEW